MSLKKNVLANYLGQGWSALMGLAFVPVYIKYIGINAYGLIGIFVILQAWLTLLDMGMTPTLNREMARFTAGVHSDQSIRNLLRSLEIICFGVACLIALIIWIVSDWLAVNWLQVGKLPPEVVGQAIAIMGVVAALRFIESVYRGAILGLQKQVFFNVVNSVLATMRAAGAVGVLIWISPTVNAYFIWQGSISVISVGILAISAHRYLPEAPQKVRFSSQAIAEIQHFATGMMGTSFLTLLLTQIDKVLLSRLLNLESFGYYTLATTVAGAIALLITPVTQAFYPRFTELVASDNTQGLIYTYHQSAQLVTVLATPPTLMLIFFSEPILSLWTGNIELAHKVSPLLSLLAIGTLLNGLLHIPYMLQLAYGWSRFSVRVNLVAVTILIPLLLWTTPRYGAIGAAWVWVILNMGYIFIAIHFMYKYLLPTEKWKWYWHDLTLPIAASTAVAWGYYLLQPVSLNKVQTLLWLFAVGTVTLVVALLAAPKLRKLLSRSFFEKIPQNA